MIELISSTQDDKAFFRALSETVYRDMIIRQFGSWDSASEGQAFEKKWLEQKYQVINLDGSEIGGIWVQEFESYHQLREIQILPAFQNQGIGTKLVLDEIERVRQLGKDLNLRVLLLNPAYDLYKRLGFKEIGKTETQYMMQFRS